MNQTYPLNSGGEGDDGSSGKSVFVPSQYFVTTHVRVLAEILMDLGPSFVLALFGIISNIVIIVVFAKQGYKDSVNISMSAIAIWDLAKCLAGAMQRMAGPLKLIDPADAESWSNVSVVAFSYLMCFSSFVSSVLAAFVAIERCLCVSMPFKVRDIITPKVTFITCFLISVGVFGLFVVMWSLYDIEWVFHPGYNRSILTYQYNDLFYEHGGPIFEYYNLSGIIWPIISFVVISICTVIIVYHLRKSSNFRTGGLSDSSGAPDKQLSKRDRQVVKMLLVIIVVYIVSLTPRIILYLVKYFIYEFYFLRLYHNLFLVMSYIVFFFDIFNAAVNIFIFLYMSSSFRSTFLSLLPCYSSKAVTNKPNVVSK